MRESPQKKKIPAWMTILVRVSINAIPNCRHWTDPKFRPIASVVCTDLMEIDRQALDATISRVAPTKWLSEVQTQSQHRKMKQLTDTDNFFSVGIYIFAWLYFFFVIAICLNKII